jgi:hypothetical protein
MRVAGKMGRAAALSNFTHGQLRRNPISRSSVDELRRVRLLRSSHRPMSRRRAHRFLKIGYLSAGVAAAHNPGRIKVPAPASAPGLLQSHEDGF